MSIQNDPKQMAELAKTTGNLLENPDVPPEVKVDLLRLETTVVERIASCRKRRKGENRD